MSESFIHLRLHSIYSLLEGAMPLKALPGLCAGQGMPAVAVTDTNNLFGALEFSETAASAGVQPIVGCQLDLAYGPKPQPGQRMTPPAPVVCLARSERGYMNLMELSSKAFLEAGDDPYHVDPDDLERWSEGVICLTGGALGCARAPWTLRARTGRGSPSPPRRATTRRTRRSRATSARSSWPRSPSSTRTRLGS